MATRLEDVPSDLIVEFDHMDQTMNDTFHERLGEIRDRLPVAYTPAHGGFWLISGYDEVHAAVRDWETFSSTEASIPSNHAGAKVLPVEVDPPDHAAYRQVLNPLFSPSRMKTLEGQIRELTVDLIDAFAGTGRCEFVSEFAHPLPTNTFLAMMGWPKDDTPQFVRWNEDILLGKPAGTAEESAEVRSAANREVFAYFERMVAERRGREGDDADDVTALVMNTVLDGERTMTLDELQRMFWVLMLGGLHTVRAVLAFGMIHLIEHPGARQRIIDDPSAIPSVVEELLRLDAPVSPGRLVMRDVELGGVPIKAGDRVLIALPGACRDPREFDRPDELVVNRVPNRHLAFNGGPHRCVGSTLARVELTVALEEIHRRIPDYRLDPDREIVKYSSQIRGVNALPLLFTPAG